MNVKQHAGQLPWKLIAALGVLALVRPVAKILGDVFDYNVSALVTVIITAVIAMIWIGLAVRLRIERPVIVLAVSGAVYAILSIALAVVIQVFAPDLGDDEAKVPVLLTVGLVATTAFNLVYGACLGFVASLIQKARNK